VFPQKLHVSHVASVAYLMNDVKKWHVGGEQQKQQQQG
jgi:hypothetical protein